MPPRKRKAPAATPVKEKSVAPETAEPEDVTMINSAELQLQRKINNIIESIQSSESLFDTYKKKMRSCYNSVDHSAFMKQFQTCIFSLLDSDESNEFATVCLKFVSQFITSYGSDDEVTHPIMKDIFSWLLNNTSYKVVFRFHVCQFVNFILCALGANAALDNDICDDIMKYMLERLKDNSSNVRIEAVRALQRLQDPENRDDAVIKAYLYHMTADPSTKVRMEIISSICRCSFTLPSLIERAWDTDDKIRRHIYLQLSSYSVRSFKVSQRLALLRQGLNDQVEVVKRAVTHVMLPQWFQAYDKNYVTFINALRYDRTESDVKDFIDISKAAVNCLLESLDEQDIPGAIEQLEYDDEFEYTKCIPFDKISLPKVIYWHILIDFLQARNYNEIDTVIPPITIFCNYIKRYCTAKSQNNMENWEIMENHFILWLFAEIMLKFDYSDEMGRHNMKELYKFLILEYHLDNTIIVNILKCLEKVITEPRERLDFCVEMLNDIVDHKIKCYVDFVRVEEALEKYVDQAYLIKLSILKVKIKDVRDREIDYIEAKEYSKLQPLSEELFTLNQDYLKLIKPVVVKYVDDSVNSNTENDYKYLESVMEIMSQSKAQTNEHILKCLKIACFMIASENVTSLTQSCVKLYKSFIRKYVESPIIENRSWALKGATAFSILYEQLAVDLFDELQKSFLCTSNANLWHISIQCAFQLIDHYGLEMFTKESVDKRITTGRSLGRQLYTTGDDRYDDDSMDQTQEDTDIICMMIHLFGNCTETSIIAALIEGFARLILRDFNVPQEVMRRFIIMFFNPRTEVRTNQLLGIFFDSLLKMNMQHKLQEALLPIILTIMDPNADSEMTYIKPEDILKFVIEYTRPINTRVVKNLHNKIAIDIFDHMIDSYQNKDLIRVFAKELAKLDIGEDSNLRKKLKDSAETVLKNETLDATTKKQIEGFVNMLDDCTGITAFSSTTPAVQLNKSNEDAIQEDEDCEAIPNDNENINSNDMNVEVFVPEEIREPSNDGNSKRNSLNSSDKENNELIEIPPTVGVNVSLRSLRKSLAVSNSIAVNKDTSVLTESITHVSPRRNKSIEISKSLSPTVKLTPIQNRQSPKTMKSNDEVIMPSPVMPNVRVTRGVVQTSTPNRTIAPDINFGGKTGLAVSTIVSESIQSMTSDSDGGGTTSNRRSKRMHKALSTSTAPEQSIVNSPLRKILKDRTISDISKKTKDVKVVSKIAKAPKLTEKKNNLMRKTLSASLDKRPTTNHVQRTRTHSADPTSQSNSNPKILRNQLSPMTRRAAKKEFELNTVMTRNKLTNGTSTSTSNQSNSSINSRSRNNSNQRSSSSTRASSSKTTTLSPKVRSKISRIPVKKR